MMCWKVMWRKGFFALDPKEREDGKDNVVYLATSGLTVIWKEQDGDFERYFLAEKETHIEKKIHTMLCLKMTVVDNIMIEFGLDPKRIHTHCKWSCAG